jgi:predicted ABC-type ATPase
MLLYLPLSDMWVIYDNSNPIPELIAECPLNSNPIIYLSQIWNTITQED